jgi:hypothetical protein
MDVFEESADEVEDDEAEDDEVEEELLEQPATIIAAAAASARAPSRLAGSFLELRVARMPVLSCAVYIPCPGGPSPLMRRTRVLVRVPGFTKP